MSIQDDISYWLDPAHQELFPIMPRMDHSPVVRHLFGTADINRLVTGPWQDKAEEIRSGKLWEDFDRFTEGRLIVVDLTHPYTKPKSTYLSRLDPGRDEVFEIRSRYPKRGIRVFGRFAACDTLILTNWEYRDQLEGPGSQQFLIEIRKAKAKWRHLFPTYDAFSGAAINDYISDNAFSLGDFG